MSVRGNPASHRSEVGKWRELGSQVLFSGRLPTPDRRSPGRCTAIPKCCIDRQTRSMQHLQWIRPCGRAPDIQVSQPRQNRCSQCGTSTCEFRFCKRSPIDARRDLRPRPDCGCDAEAASLSNRLRDIAQGQRVFLAATCRGHERAASSARNAPPKAEGVYKGRPASIDVARVRELKAQGLSGGPRLSLNGSKFTARASIGCWRKLARSHVYMTSSSNKFEYRGFFY